MLLVWGRRRARILRSWRDLNAVEVQQLQEQTRPCRREKSAYRRRPKQVPARHRQHQALAQTVWQLCSSCEFFRPREPVSVCEPHDNSAAWRPQQCQLWPQNLLYKPWFFIISPVHAGDRYVTRGNRNLIPVETENLSRGNFNNSSMLTDFFYVKREF